MDILEQLRQNRWIIWAKEEEPAEEYPQVQLVSICYRSDDCEVRGYVGVPREEKGPLPAVIFNRGGNRAFSALRPQVICKYASQGFVVLGSQYRGNCGGTGQEEFGGADVNDVLRLIDIALELPGTFKGGVYMAGHSRGGMMTYRCCALDDRIVAAAVGSGVADCVDMYNKRVDDMKQVFQELLGGTPEEVPEEYRRRSAVCWVEKIKPPILIVHGTADWRVDVSQAREMEEKLQRYGKEHKVEIFEGADHSLKGTTYFQDVVAWFRQHPITPTEKEK